MGIIRAVTERAEDEIEARKLREEAIELGLVDRAKEIIKDHGGEDTNRVLLADHTDWGPGLINAIASVLEEEGFRAV